MFNNVALDVFIGWFSFSLLYSLLATIVQEIIATKLAFRARFWKKLLSGCLKTERALLEQVSRKDLRAFGHLLVGPIF
jgi:hypothetical protein